MKLLHYIELQKYVKILDYAP